MKWSASEGLAWKLALPTGSGSTPIVSGDRIFLSVAEGDTVSLWCLDRKTSAALWKKPLGASAGHAHRKHNMSTPSPVTDGKRVFAMTGQGALKGFDLSGQELWARDLQKEYGPFGTNWGYGSSPLLFEGVLYVPVLHGMKTDEPSYLLGVEAATGKNRFRVERVTKAHTESPDAYTTPTAGAARREGRDRGHGRRRRHRPRPREREGAVARERPQSRRQPVLPHRGLAGRRGRRRGGADARQADAGARAFGSGDVTTSALLWSFDSGPDVPTPATDGTLLYVVRDNGVLYCLDLATGKTVYGPERLRSGTYSSSPLLADGKLYLTSEDGVTSVVKAGTSLRAAGRERARRLHGQLARGRLGPALPPHHQPPVRDREPPRTLVRRSCTRERRGCAFRD